MRIGLIAATPPPIGGIATWTMRMLNISENHDCEYVLIDEKMDADRNMFGDRQTRKRNIVKEFRRCKRIWQDLIVALRDESVELIHTNIPSTITSMLRESICCIITHMKHRKFLIEFHCTVPNTKAGLIWKVLLTFLITQSDGIFVLNQQSYDYLISKTKKPLFIIPNFVMNDEINESHEIKTNIEKIIYVGGVIESKGVLDIIEVAKKYNKADFVFVGNPDTKILELSRGVENVHFTGSCEHGRVRELLNDSDIFIFLSYFSGEGFSVALLEAMASGLPCIVTDWAANKDMIGEEGGAVVAVHDTDRVLEALRLLESQDVRLKASKRNICTVKENYSDTAVFTRIIAGYKTIIDRR